MGDKIVWDKPQFSETKLKDASATQDERQKIQKDALTFIHTEKMANAEISRQLKHIGIIKGGGIGPEIIDATLVCLQEIERISQLKFAFTWYTGPVEDESEETYLNLKKFYEEIKAKSGVILRASVHAPIVYRLRRDFNLFYKLIPLKAIPELLDISPLRREVAEDIDILLIRENNHGIYHTEGKWESSSVNERIAYGMFIYSERDVASIAHIAFKLATQRRRHLHLFIKHTVLGKIGELWVTTFCTIHQQYPEVRLEIVPPDMGAAEMFIDPKHFDVIVALDVDSDLLADHLAGLLNGTRGVIPSANFNHQGFATYQTIHGKAESIAGKDRANPIAITMAAAMLLDLSFGLHKESNLICKAIRDVLSEGYRTEDIFRPGCSNHKLIGTKEMGLRISKAISKI